MVSSNIEKHSLVPKHIKLTKEEAEEVLNQFNISKKQLPRILKTDPAVTNLDVKQGDIIKIIRGSNTTTESIFYRSVI